MMTQHSLLTGSSSLASSPSAASQTTRSFCRRVAARASSTGPPRSAHPTPALVYFSVCFCVVVVFFVSHALLCSSLAAVRTHRVRQRLRGSGRGVRLRREGGELNISFFFSLSLSCAQSVFASACLLRRTELCRCLFFSRSAIRSVARSAPWPTALTAATGRAAIPHVWYVVYIWSSGGRSSQSSDLFPPRSTVLSAGVQLPLRRQRL